MATRTGISAASLPIDLSHIRLEGITRVKGRLPEKTSIKALGLTRDGASLLTPKASKLTKTDLEALRDNIKSAKDLGLSVSDVNSIRSAFSTPLAIGAVGVRGNALSVSCCCCTPCCCAATALDSIQLSVA